jgi:hypothetical protein
VPLKLRLDLDGGKTLKSTNIPIKILVFQLMVDGESGEIGHVIQTLEYKSDTGCVIILLLKMGDWNALGITVK